MVQNVRLIPHAPVGDLYAPVGKGSGLLSHGGSYVTFIRRAASNTLVRSVKLGEAPDMTVVIEKMSHQGSTSAWARLAPYVTSAENLTLHLGSSYGGRELALWRSLVPSATVAAGKDNGIPGLAQMMIKQPGPLHATCALDSHRLSKPQPCIMRALIL